MFYHSRQKEDRMSAEVTNGANVASVTACTPLLRYNIRLQMFSSCTCLMILEYVIVFMVYVWVYRLWNLETMLTELNCIFVVSP